jgi:DNA-directed RNA polymerase subunit RPC12/RpoP
LKNKTDFTPVRFVHITSYAGVGSIIRSSSNKLITIKDIRYWKNSEIRNIPFVNRIKRALKIRKNFRLPPTAKKNDNGQIVGDSIPAILFPTTAVCSKCGLLYHNPWKTEDISRAEQIKCECGEKLEQVTWCAVSEKGYLSEVPWHEICHTKRQNDCRADFNIPYLRIYTNNSGKKYVKCTRCNAEASFENTKIKITHRKQPWIHESVKNDLVDILEVNNPLIYLPVKVNALVIPPESRVDKSSVVYKLSKNSKDCREIIYMKKERRDYKIRTLANEYKCEVEEIKAALKMIEEGYPDYDEYFQVTELMYDEYKAFLTPLEDVKESEDFVTIQKKKEWDKLKMRHQNGIHSTILSLIDNLVIAQRLREIQIFKGFYRITQNSEENMIPPDIEGKADWLPAIELFGEGVFFTINIELLARWENISSVKNRAHEIAKRYENSAVDIHKDIEINPRFIFLHTLSHLLIRELEAIVGYPAASLRERIYSSIDNKMAGILIYVAVPDIVGSLGGITEYAEPMNFLNVMDNALKHAQWCSLDPVCSEHQGQGPGWLNRAACHACALIPETSCEYNNVLLDRVFIKGSQASEIIGFVDFAKGVGINTISWE